MSEKKDEDYDWTIGLVLIICIVFIFLGLYDSNWTQILGGLLSFCVFSFWYSGLIKSLLKIKAEEARKK